MSSIAQITEKSYQKYAWIILLVISILLALNMLFLIAESGPEMFKEDTGIDWVEFSGAYPTVAITYAFSERFAFVASVGLALYAAGITFFTLRKGEHWSWYLMWILPLYLTLTTVILASTDEAPIAIGYGIAALIAVIGLLLPIKKFFS